ncbi:uncharacterized protein ACHE_70041S [Aspergillus chevalieri]|uniref:Uncharacterized protein n=1 Tax=Aspergillus chevalieri TaxID=182096 RepID=A0A7R7VUT1_ASPCH|nr:uncharacterized protein ACHE_70041S [Aspergillus chevalieri]BCR91198.1 hypothetical protein ACHE_70041S [Aspergillus chevalieri]
MDPQPEIFNLEDFTSSSPETDPNVEGIPVQLTNSKSHSLQTSKIEYIDDLPEYPTSHIHGYSYVVASRGRSQNEMEQLVHEIQYSRRQQHGPRRPVKCPFFNCLVKRWTWKCSGIYACEFLNPFLQSYHHTFVDEDCWDVIRNTQRNIQILEANIGKRNAYSYYRSKNEFFNKGYACIDQLPTCKPVFKRHTQMNVHGEFPPYIGCSNGSNEFLTKHHRGSIQGHTSIDLQFLEDLFNHDIMPPTEECGVFESLASRRKYCDRDHLQGPGRLQHTSCGVIFTALVPVDINECPYILFTSHGIHQHPPPPPSKAPERILQGVKRIIQQIQDPSLTTAQFLRSPQLEAFCQQYGASTLAEIHSSFCNKDRIATIIQKQRLLSYPNGQDINGLLFLQNRDSLINEYIQEKYHDSQGTMIMDPFQELRNEFSSTIRALQNEIESVKNEPKPLQRPKPCLPDPEKFNGQSLKFDTWLASMKAKLRIDAPAIGDAVAQFYYVYLNLESKSKL